MARKISWEHEPYPIRKTLDGWDEEYSSVDEFKQHLTADLLSSEKCGTGDRWVFWTPETEYSSGDLEPDSNVFSTSITEKITHVLRKIASERWFTEPMLVQFWAEEEVDGRCCLATLHQPFAVVHFLTKGASWLRKKCMQQYHIADDAAEEDELGPPGRVFRNGNPESSPDILLYSTKEFPLRDLATGCVLKSYLAIPIFDVHNNQCVGVLEFIYQESVKYLLDFIYKKSVKWSPVVDALQNLQSQPQPLREIRVMLDLAIKSVPQLHLAQVWVPCNQCANNSSCMEWKTLTSTYSPIMELSDEFTKEFVAACGFHNIQNGRGIVWLALWSTNNLYFCENLSEFSISEYPMKHYAQRARFSSCFAICPRNKHNGNDICVFKFFLQPQSRDDASIQPILHLLLKIMEKMLKSFEISTEQYLGVEFQPLEKHMLALPMKKYKETFSVVEFKEFFQNTDLSCSQKRRIPNYGWICWNTNGEESSENRGNDILMPQLNLGTEGIKLLLTETLPILQASYYNFLIQFWAPKFVDNKLVLSTSEQPFALDYLQKGLCWYRKQCVQYLYCIGDGAKEEELGPPGRVFLDGRTESSPDPRLYSRREFPLRDYLVCSGTTAYLALPLFGLLGKQCVGVLEFVGLPFWWDDIYENIKVFCSFLQKYNMRCTHISSPSSFPIAEGKKHALSEITEMLMLVVQSPQLQTASVWTPRSQCAHNNIEISCMERAKMVYDSPNDWRIRDFIKACEFHQPQITNGVIRKVIESESKLYFCEDICNSSICEQPLAHYVQAARLEICFAICLKSSYTGSSLYVVEYFLSPHSKKYEYSRTLCFLLSMMKQKLKSFKVASGQLLAEELISEVHFEDVSQNITGFSTANQLTVEKSGGQCILPLGFENVQYGHVTEHQYSQNQIHFTGIDVASNIDQEQERNISDAINQVEDEAQNITDHVNFEEGNERDRSSTSFHVSNEQLKSQFGKSRKDAAKNLGVSISTFKRKCRDYGINRWPSRINNINNPSLFRTKVANKFVENADHQTSQSSGCDLAISDFPVEPNLSSPPTEHANTCQAADVVIKAKFKDKILKFEYCVSRGVEKLMEEVGKRLKLKMEELELKYVDDDDGDLISLTCDEDLHFYVKSMKSIGKTSVQVLVHLISE